MNLESEDRVCESLIQEIRSLAGRLGEMGGDLENVADAENYDFQVQTGLASATAQILEGNPFKAIVWFGHCLISCGVEPDERIKCLLDSLSREIEAAEPGPSEEE